MSVDVCNQWSCFSDGAVFLPSEGEKIWHSLHFACIQIGPDTERAERERGGNGKGHKNQRH